MGERQTNVDELARKYASPRPAVVGELVRRVLGTPLANGYTTLQQVDEAAELLDLRQDDRLLDLGAGRGWPGLRLASERKCSLVSADLTVEAATVAKECLRTARLDTPTSVVVASGVDLPFRASVFNAVIHADVLC